SLCRREWEVVVVEEPGFRRSPGGGRSTSRLAHGRTVGPRCLRTRPAGRTGPCRLRTASSAGMRLCTACVGTMSALRGVAERYAVRCNTVLTRTSRLGKTRTPFGLGLGRPTDATPD